VAAGQASLDGLHGPLSYKVCEPAARIGGIHYRGVAVCDLSVDSGSNRAGSACQLSL
jgi:hypothetical protein